MGSEQSLTLPCLESCAEGRMNLQNFEAEGFVQKGHFSSNVALEKMPFFSKFAPFLFLHLIF